jgi:hypothetical protein
MGKRVLAMFLCLITIAALMPLQSYAAIIDTDADGNIVVTSIKYAVNHDVFATESGYVEIIGTNLLDVDFLFDVDGKGFQLFSDKSTNTNTFVKYTLTSDEVESFLGRIKAGSVIIDLDSADFPNLQSSDKQTINIDDDQPYTLTFNGNFLDTLNTGNITATYGAGLSRTSLGTTTDPNKLELTNATNPGRLGYQNVILNKKDTTVDPAVEIEYTYTDAFRIVEDLGVTDVTMFPNTGSKGDEVYFTGENFSDTRNYQVYFLKALDGSDPYSDTNKATFVSLGLNVDGTQDVLTVTVPEGTDFERRNYYVVITDSLNGQIVAEEVVLNTEGDYDQYTVIESGYKPTIETVYPETGPDTGGNVQISGRNLVTLSIPDLTSDGTFLNDPTTESNEQILVLDYNQGYYKGELVDINRKINVQIGKKTTFTQDSQGDYQVVKGIPDSIIVTTDVIDDAETDPLKDVVIEIVTTLTVSGGTNDGKKYIFNQSVTATDGFEFEPSSYTPEITSVTPSTIQVEDYDSSYMNFSNNTQIAIKGDKFLVDRFVDTSGNIVTQYPTVLIKKNDDNTFNTRYQLGFFPNETAVNSVTGLDEVRGIIKYKPDETGSTEYILRDSDGNPIQMVMTVLNDDNEVVDGTSSNQIGTKILITAPSSTLIADAGIKHLQVTNPTRDSLAYGKSAIKSDYFEFIKTTDIPVIESVKPSIVTVDGGETVTVTGSNFQDGITVNLDGESITTFTRELDNTGTKMIITFTAPAGREGTTQLQLMNPSGGMAVSDFTYVTTFNEAPTITNFTPTRGSYDTLVVVNGNNFLKADPTATSEIGINAYRLMGTRVLLDDTEVNSYNTDAYGNVDYIDYTVPDVENVIYNDSGQAKFSDFYENAVIRSASDSSVASFGNDADNNPAIYTDSEVYSFKYVSGVLYAYDSDGNSLGVATQTLAASGVETIALDGTDVFEITIDNHLVRVDEDSDGIETAALSDYADAVILYSGSDYFTLSYNFSGEAVLTNGKDKSYTLSVDSSGNIIAATSSGTTSAVTTTSTGLTVGALSLLMKTPYTVDSNGNISGKRVTVISKTQLMFKVPYMSTGKGYKDLTIVNPDTKNASLTDSSGFYYITQATSTPAITTIVPNKGSTDGGYYVTISGSGFEDGAKVYIDSVVVPTADTYVALDGTSITIKVPASIKNLVDDYGVDSLAVPVIVINEDGGNAYKINGFTYIIPQSDPSITSIVPTTGSSNGGEIVEIIGYEFRFYEPYENSVGGSSYDVGDSFEDLYPNGEWDNLLSSSVDSGAITEVPELTNDYYDYYYTSDILPKVYFGEKEAHIVEYAKGYLKVITPEHDAGAVDVYVINNDSGVSNTVTFTYASSSPTITKITPSFGKRSGGEPKDLYGTKFYQSQIYGYIDDDDTQIQLIEDVDASVRFGEIDNIDSVRTDTDYGLINSQRATVNLTGGLTLNYYGDTDQVKLTVTENNVIYTRTFTYDDSTVYIPTGMLQDAAGDYYVPYGLKNVDATTYSGDAYEYVKVYIEDRRVVVARGYAPTVIYDNDTHVKVYTPPYYTIGSVNVIFTNKDGGKASRTFTYTNPDSEPKIYDVEPKEIAYDESAWLIESSFAGGIDIEITGDDIRSNPTVYIGSYTATVKELTTTTINGTTYDLLVVTVPAGTVNDVNERYPIIIQNEDMGLATSDNITDLIGPNYNATTVPYYFVYKQPLSDPKISTVSPAKTSIAGGNTITITGSDFRSGAYVVIGTRAGIPIYDATISDDGTKITFETPDNMTLGTKTVQVVNEDYGIGIAEDSLTVVSAPTLDGYVYDTDGNAIDRIHVTGGQEIMLQGTGFAENATVYFGGEWLTVASSDTTIADSEIGVYTDDTEYYVLDGYKGTSVTYVDENTILVTTPEVTFEGSINIVLKNEDGGITDDGTSTDYTVPIPEDPTGLKVEIINDQYIKLYDYVSDTADYFEIYVYIGSYSDVTLNSTHNYRDFSYLGITDVEPYKITELPGWDNMNAGERIVFVVKGVNKYGPSGYSNLASLTYEEVSEMDMLGPEDLDGEITLPEGQDYETIQNGGIATVNFNSTAISSIVSVDLSDDLARNTTKKVINLPETLVKQSLSNVNVNFGDSMYRFSPVIFNATAFKTIAQYYDAYASINEDTEMTLQRSYLQPSIRGKKQVSDVYSISFEASSNEQTQRFDQLTGNLDLTLFYDDKYLTMAKESQIQLYKYNSATGSYDLYTSTLDAANNSVTARINSAGHYVLLTNY